MKQSNEKVKLVQTRDGKNFLLPFILITSLFFLWGFAHSILDVLNKHFQDALGITRTRSALIQAVVYGGYFLMALPETLSGATATGQECLQDCCCTASVPCSSFRENGS